MKKEQKCKVIITRKKRQCRRPIMSNGYCGWHLNELLKKK